MFSHSAINGVYIRDRTFIDKDISLNSHQSLQLKDTGLALLFNSISKKDEWWLSNILNLWRMAR